MRIAGHIAHAVMRHTRLRGCRLGAVLGLAAAAAIAGGAGGMLLAILAGIIVLDAVVPTPGLSRSAADDHFRRLVRERRQGRLARRVRRRPPERLDVLDDRVGWAATAPRRELGVQSIRLDSVTGTVEELQARRFDRRFRPDPSAAEHWKRLWVAQAHGANLPPISVYRVASSHVVRDGHHRVSVARDHGFAMIDAEVVELGRPRD